MKELFSAFESPSKQEWLEKIKVDLKGKEFDSSMINNYSIEDIEFWSQHHRSDTNQDHQVPGSGSFKRGNRTENNEWEIVAEIPATSPKEMNAFALDCLMKGNTALTIDLGNFNNDACKEIVNQIGFDHISTTFKVNTNEQLEFVEELLKQFPNARIDVFNSHQKSKTLRGRSQLINAVDILNAGGNSIQEIAYALHEGHTQLHSLLSNGETIDKASLQLKFTFGIGNLYFIEIAKFRAFRSLWSFIIEQYNPKEECSKTAYIEAKSIFVNKSLQDPYTNLLRLTTEGLSAAVGGVNEINLLPYDTFAENKKTHFTQRMSNNISLLLKEEAYINQVIDVAGGSYALEKITEEIQSKAWELFQSIEKEGLKALKEAVLNKRKQRIEAVENGSQMLIGVNKYPNIETVTNNWIETPETPFGSYLILERDAKTELA
ncbi:MAG: methylmalonyl-CoA mutase family protein [Lishizhenia sp.]